MDTIEILEAIGSDAGLRYASTEELTNLLESVQATDALTAAIASDDTSLLAREFGNNTMLLPQIVQTYS
ncbi:hypothetical protein [Luteibacter sp. dw_328]|uniref:hypothetical protein n=1 Tax=Luteibacter sp. dw_328 TaxID=2719796 RepID=UPI001BD2B68A|nr:hypothetical protein [Luteibacter sp. dw_328]